MSIDHLLALAAFALVTSITPGPNNLMLMASGANFGFRLTVPHMLGVALGFVFMLVIVGMGIAGIFTAYPRAYDVLTVLSVIYLVYLAWKIARAGEPAKAGATVRPMTFLQAALFQWVNPKAWAMALSAVTVYAPSQDLSTIVMVGVIFGAINLPAVSSWTVLGQQMRRFLTNPVRLRTFNIVMALLLIATLYPLVAG
ncbi:LysE family translocator [Minwuia sp.]|uniref:LysE family translocator n=1 Tax=Minwuia sp. TaxID=2493630 RepID=UPI003A91868E